MSSRTPSKLELASGWQDELPEWSEKFAFLLNNPHLSDLKLLVGDPEESRKEFYAHKFILATSSSVFERQFYNGNFEQRDSLQLPDMDPDTFWHFLQYVYTGKLDENLEQIQLLSLLSPADKYLIKHMKDKLSSQLVKGLRTGNLLETYEYACLYSLEEVRKACEYCIDRDAKQIVASTHFRNLKRETLAHILERDGLDVDEEELVVAVVGWATEECQRNELEPNPNNFTTVLGDCLKLVRFASMSADKFCKVQDATKLLTREQGYEIFMQICRENLATVEGEAMDVNVDESTLTFSNIVRKFNPKLKTVTPFYIEPTPFIYNVNRGDSLNGELVFEVDQPVVLKGVNLFQLIWKQRPQEFSFGMSPIAGAPPRFGESAGTRESIAFNTGNSFFSPSYATNLIGSSSSGRLLFSGKNIRVSVFLLCKTGTAVARKDLVKAGDLKSENAENPKHFPVKFDSGVNLCPGEMYTVVAKIIADHDGDDMTLHSYRGNSTMQQQEIFVKDTDDYSLKDVNFRFSIQPCNPVGTRPPWMIQIAGLIFC